MFSIFTLAIKFDCLFLAIFQSFHLFVGFIFNKLAPPNICFKRCFKSLFSPILCIKQSQKCQKRSAFPILHFGRHANGRGYSPPPPPRPPDYATEYTHKDNKRLIFILYTGSKQYSINLAHNSILIDKNDGDSGQHASNRFIVLGDMHRIRTVGG